MDTRAAEVTNVETLELAYRIPPRVLPRPGQEAESAAGCYSHDSACLLRVPV